MAYLTNSETDKKKMLSAIGVDSVEDIIKNIPQNLRFTGTLNLPRPLSEMEAKQLLQSLSDRNMTGISFLGGGVYDHYIPAIVDEISSRPEFYTSYTPYQPEVSQGNLQSMYEFQSMICELTGMDVTNASMYEAGSALAEAILLAVAHTGKKKVILPATINPRYLAVIKSYVVN
ncbi:MAG TPA: glycine dehydrogenase, partial [Caldithrix abyssi]|nr:glycine dehydrogenase [Caldithrix abyssi]